MGGICEMKNGILSRYLPHVGRGWCCSFLFLFFLLFFLPFSLPVSLFGSKRTGWWFGGGGGGGLLCFALLCFGLVWSDIIIVVIIVVVVVVVLVRVVTSTCLHANGRKEANSLGGNVGLETGTGTERTCITRRQ